MLEIDMNKKLEVKINNQQPVGLKDLTISLLSFQGQFQRFVEVEAKGYEVGTDLMIKEVRRGSIVIELVAQAAPVLPLLWDGGTLVQWCKFVEDTAKWFLGEIGKQPAAYTKKDLQDWNSFVEPIAKDEGSSLNMSFSDCGTVIQNINISSPDAKQIQNRISELIREQEEPNSNVHKKKVMYWYQAKFDAKASTGNKAIIDDISPKSHKVIFADDDVKTQMMRPHETFDKAWQDLAYVVDVEVQTVRGSVGSYKVLKFYPDDTFDPFD